MPLFVTCLKFNQAQWASKIGLGESRTTCSATLPSSHLLIQFRTWVNIATRLTLSWVMRSRISLASSPYWTWGSNCLMGNDGWAFNLNRVVFCFSGGEDRKWFKIFLWMTKKRSSYIGRLIDFELSTSLVPGGQSPFGELRAGSKQTIYLSCTDRVIRKFWGNGYTL